MKSPINTAQNEGANDSQLVSAHFTPHRTVEAAKLCAKELAGRHCHFENPNQTGEDDRYCNMGPLDGAHIAPVDTHKAMEAYAENIIPLCRAHHNTERGSLDKLTDMDSRREWVEKNAPRWWAKFGRDWLLLMVAEVERRQRLRRMREQEIFQTFEVEEEGAA